MAQLCNGIIGVKDKGRDGALLQLGINEQYQVIFPPDVHYAVYHAKNPVTSYPISKGKFANNIDYGDGTDVSWWANSPVANSFFAAESKYEFFGGFLAGALTSAATILACTERIRVGIGILPAVARNPLFTAMEFTTLACLYPGRFMPGFGHGYEPWMKQIGAYPKSPLAALEETVTAVRELLRGESVTLHGSYVHLENVKMDRVPPQVPPLLIGAIREKSLRLAGRAGDGTILTEMSSPAYLRWAREQVAAGMVETGRTYNHLVVYTLCKVNPDGVPARQLARQALAARLAGSSAHLVPLGIAAEAQALLCERGVDGAEQSMPESWG